MNVFQLQIECRRDEAEQLDELLDTTGALSITMTDKHDDAILEPELGTTPLWPNVVIHALFEEKELAQHAEKILLLSHPHLTAVCNELPEQDWARACLKDFKPLQFGKRLWICPSWLTPPDAEAVNLVLDPGLAFGTGTHATTSLCLTWLEQAPLAQKTIIDYGCGSGILALAALKLGAQHAYAVDIDAQALLATQENAKGNDIPPAQLSVSFPDSLNTKADILIANILLSPLLKLRERFYELLKNNGILVVSGVLAEQVDSLLGEYNEQFLHENTLIQGDWALVIFKKL
ncbi:50S ribosomal protein L11 methyltransferase [Legionella septentrionalis]|uniref:Ribosomal protein L11 methyltransferase n=1 Tax=Legionella septentrionalis TaxID=2498109 RepID=A0A3S1CMI6_9GAMM|nr:50S ribosomal protein L11 methyltransferase [Legionella septentrionalis]RUR13933.1 50S ribosomal protein L11 methyltransferase [Legionella septentrionalis]